MLILLQVSFRIILIVKIKLLNEFEIRKYYRNLYINKFSSYNTSNNTVIPTKVFQLT